MTVPRRVSSTKRYKYRGGVSGAGGFFAENKILIIIIAAAVALIVVLFIAPGILTQGKDEIAGELPSETPATITLRPSPSPSPSVSAVPSPSVSTAPASPEASPAIGSRVLKYTKPNMQGDDVWALQERLDLEPDGYFGKATSEAVKKFQEKNGLTADGIVGESTWKKLGLLP